MKNLFKSIMFVAAAAMTFTSCSKDEESVVTPESKNITLSFSSEKPELEGTRTEHNGTTVVWSHGDRIKLAYTLNGTYMGANAGEDPKFYTSNDAVITEVDDTHNTARFNVHGNFRDDTKGEYRFFALYPDKAYDSSNTTINKAPSVPVRVADTQSPKAASFDHNADLMIGLSTEAYTGIPADRMVSLLWRRLVAHAQITFKDIAVVDGETVNFVTFTAEEGKELTGTYNLNIETGEFETKTASNSVKLIGEGLAIDNRQLEAWFCSLPFTTSRFTVVIDTNKATYTREVVPGSELSFEQNSRNKLIINMANAIREDKSAEVQLIADGDYVIAIEETYNQMMIVGSTTAGYRGVRALSTETIDGKLVVDDDAIWTITYEAEKGGYTIMSYSEGTYISAATSGNAKLGSTPLTLDIQSVDGGYEIFTPNATKTFKLGYNNSAKRFAFYEGTLEHTLQIIPAFVDTTPTISVDPAELSFPAAGGDKTITVTAKYFGEYTVSATSSNPHFTTAKQGNVVTVTAPANETSAAITGTITITVTDGANTKSTTVAVEQAAAGGNIIYQWTLPWDTTTNDGKQDDNNLKATLGIYKSNGDFNRSSWTNTTNASYYNCIAGYGFRCKIPVNNIATTSVTINASVFGGKPTAYQARTFDLVYWTDNNNNKKTVTTVSSTAKGSVTINETFNVDLSNATSLFIEIVPKAAGNSGLEGSLTVSIAN